MLSLWLGDLELILSDQDINSRRMTLSSIEHLIDEQLCQPMDALAVPLNTGLYHVLIGEPANAQGGDIAHQAEKRYREFDAQCERLLGMRCDGALSAPCRTAAALTDGARRCARALTGSFYWKERGFIRLPCEPDASSPAPDGASAQPRAVIRCADAGDFAQAAQALDAMFSLMYQGQEGIQRTREDLNRLYVQLWDMEKEKGVLLDESIDGNGLTLYEGIHRYASCARFTTRSTRRLPTARSSPRA